jgi:hypothetical protein
MNGRQWQRWLGQLFRLAHRQRTSPRRTSGFFRLALEQIEDRIVPSTVTVMDSSDNPSDTGSLRYILNNAISGETIDFSPSVRDITLNSANAGLTITKSVTITNDQGSGPVTIDGVAAYAVFTVDVTASLSGMTITGGSNGIINNSTLQVSDCTITENISPNSGAGIYNGLNGTGILSVIDCSITNNSCDGSGGGIYSVLYSGLGSASISNSTISDNSADATGLYGQAFGAGICNGAPMTIVNCTISGNSIQASTGSGNNSDGGGIYNSHQITITNSTIIDNTVSVVGGPAYGGGIANTGGTALLNGDIVAGNSVSGSGGTTGNDIYAVTGAYLSNASADNVIGTGGSGGLVNGTNGNQVGVAFASINLDPDGLQNNGGPTQTIALEPGSLAIGTGYTETSATTDQRGVPRPVGIPSDVGAYQLSSAPLVTSNPSNVTIDPGTTAASFTAAASGYPTPTVQWQVSTNGGINFTNLADGGNYSGSATGTLNITGITTSMNGYEYRALFSNTPVGASSSETATSLVATLTVDYVPSITSNPANQTINTGGTATFSATASGNPSPTVQWEVSTDGGNTFSNISNGGVYSGVTTDTLTITNAGSSMNGYEYQAVFTNTLFGASSSSTATSNPATLFVDYAPSVITNPPTNRPLNAGNETTFSVAASGWPIPGIQWQVSTDGGTIFTNISNGSIYSGVTTTTLIITDVTASMNGYLYQAVFSNLLLGAENDSIAISTTTTLIVDSAPSITSNPTTVEIVNGNTTTFTVAASANPTPSVQWQVSIDGGITYNDISNGGFYSGVTTDTLTIIGATAEMNGYLYQAVFSNTLFGDSSPSITITDSATLIVDFAASVITNPTNQTVIAGDTISFSAGASGYPAPSVQWQVSTDDGNTFTDVSNGGVYSGATSTTLNITDATAAMNGYLYQAIFSNTLVGAGSPSTAITTDVTLIVDYGPTVITDPTNTEVDVGSNTSFVVEGSGYPSPSVQWQVSTDGGNTFTNISNGGVYSGVTADTLTITGATLGMDGYLYQAILTNTLFGAGSPSIVTTTAATLSLDFAPTVTADPLNATVNANGTASFTVAASDGYPTLTTVQWQISTDGGTTFNNINDSGIYSGVTTTTLSISNALASFNGDEYRAIFSNAADLSSITNAATLTVDYSPSVTKNPSTETINIGSIASFTVAGSGDPSPSVQWQVSTDGGTTFTNVIDGGFYSGATTDTLIITGATTEMNGYLYEAVFTNTLLDAGSPSSDTTSAAMLTVDFAPSVTGDPSNLTINAGGFASFSATATGLPLPTVQWEVSANGGTTFTDVSDGGIYSGATTDTLNITSAAPAMNGYLYEAVFSNILNGAGSPSSATTTAAALTVDYAPTVITNPTDLTINSRGKASFTAAASGNPLPTVQWQVSIDGGTTFTNVSNGDLYSGATTDTLIITGATTEMNGYLYEAIFSNTLLAASSPSTATTIAGMLTVDFAPNVTTDPGNQTIISGSNTTFAAAATGNPTPTIQWQVSTNGGASFTDVINGSVYSGATTDTLNITSATPAMNGYLYQAVFTNTLFDAESTSTATTTPATMTVDYAPTVTTNPTNATVVMGNSTTFTAEASGDPIPTVQWQVSTDGGITFANVNNGGFYSGANTDTLDITNATISMNGYRYQAIFSNMLNGASSPTTTSTSAALLSVVQPGDPATSSLSVTSSTLQSGTTIEITLQAKNSLGNDDTGGGLTVGFALANKNGGGQGTFSPTIDNGDGTYTAIFTGTLEGENTITSTINGQPITTILPSITVTAGPIEPSNSAIFIAASPIQLGGTTTITLQVKDAYDNDLTTSGLKVAFFLANKTGAKGTFSKVTDNHNGTYTAIFTGTLDGTNTITATVNTLPVGATAAVSVEGKTVNLAQSIATIASLQITAGTTTVVTLQAEYPPNQIEPAGGLTVAFRLGSTTGGQGAFSAVTDHGNGTYTAIFTGTLAGINTIKAYIDGQAVTSIAPAFKVVTGPLSLAKSPVTLSSKSMKAGGTITVTLQPEDAGGNKLILSPNQTIQFSTASGQGTFGSVILNKNGTYSATFTTNYAGSYIIETTINGQAVASTAPTLAVTPVAVSLTNSVLNVSKESVGVGSEVTVTLTAVDNYGNLEAMGLAVTFMLGSGQGTFGKVTYAGNGIYQATFTASKAGSYTIEAAIAGAKIKSTASIIVTSG